MYISQTIPLYEIRCMEYTVKPTAPKNEIHVYESYIYSLIFLKASIERICTLKNP
jgi:hypothetical protein